MRRAPVLRLDRLVRTFHQGPRKIAVLNGASADILPGQAVALVGPSGAGKSTLLHIAGLLETPDGGHVVINGQDCTGMGDADRTRVRRVQMGFVYQFHQLLPEFSALENVVIPQMILGRSRRVAGQRAAEMLGALGLADRVSHRPAQLSGGEQQRTPSLARSPTTGSSPTSRPATSTRIPPSTCSTRSCISSTPRGRRAHRHPQPGAGAAHGPRPACGGRPARRGGSRLGALAVDGAG